MIPQAYITEWSNHVPWQTHEQVEQDLVICRALFEIFSDEWLASHLAFRGGTAIHKLFLAPQPRYSEDIDLVQISSEPIKETVEHLQECLSFLGEASIEPRKDSYRLKFRYDSESLPVQKMRLKVEINTREHSSVLGFEKVLFEVRSSWFSGSCTLTTFKPEELLGTKLRALYQRRKGRDLFDLYIAQTKKPDLKNNDILKCYREYMKFSVDHPPTGKQYLQNMEAKMKDAEFLGDTTGLLRPEIIYNPAIAYELVRNGLIEKI